MAVLDNTVTGSLEIERLEGGEASSWWLEEAVHILLRCTETA